MSALDLALAAVTHQPPTHPATITPEAMTTLYFTLIGIGVFFASLPFFIGERKKGERWKRPGVLQWLLIVFVLCFAFPFAFIILGLFLLSGYLRKKPAPPEEIKSRISKVSSIRGSIIVTVQELNARLWGKEYPERDKLIVLGDVVIPVEREPQHFLIAGKTGAGKSQAIGAVLDVVQARQVRALVADPGGGYLARYGKRNSVVFNPLDRRSVKWSPFAEIRIAPDCKRIAKAAIPDAKGDSGEWHSYAQTLLAETLYSLWKKDIHSVRELLRLVGSADAAELDPHFDDYSPAKVFCRPGNEKMLANTRAVISTYLESWRYLSDFGNFSLRNWVRDEQNKGWVFLTYRDDQLALLRNLVATMLEIGIVECLSLDESDTRQLWFIMDEFDSLGKVPALKHGFTKLRKYGGRCVCGLQTVAQARDTYGKDEAQTLLSSMANKLVLAAGDHETAKYFEDDLGKAQLERETWGSGKDQSEGESKANTWGAARTDSTSTSESTNFSSQVVIESVVLASEIMGLPDLHGYLRMIGNPIAKIELTYVKRPSIETAYEEGDLSLV